MPFGFDSPARILAPAPRRLPGGVIGYLAHVVRPYRLAVFGIILVMVTISSVTASTSFGARGIVDAVVKARAEGAPASHLAGAIGFFFGLLVLRIMLEWVVWFMSYHVRMPLTARVRQEIYAYVAHHPVTYFDDNLSGRIIHKTVQLADQSLYLIERTWWDFSPAFGFFTAAIGYFIFVQPFYGVGLLFWLMAYFILSFLIGRRTVPLAAATNEAKSQISGRIADIITNIRNVVLNATHGDEESHVGEAVMTAMRTQRRYYLSVLRMRGLHQAMSLLLWSALLWFGGHDVWQGRITAGDFTLVVMLTTMLVQRATDIGQLLPEFFDQLGATQEALDTLVLPERVEEKPGTPPLAVTEGGIEIKGLRFAYPGQKPLFANLDLAIRPGEKIGLVGPSGGGKTTLVGLLLRLYAADGGQILVDGQDIAAHTAESLRRQIALIPQDAVLFHRSLADNIRHGRRDATLDEIKAAARAAQAEAFIDSLPHGYDTLVGERGVKLSGGQRQRVAIARALLKDAPILILDEATAALDSATEAEIQEAMKVAMAGRTVIAIAHRLSTIAHLDRLIVLEGGAIVESGTHRSLLEKGGLYAQLWAHQVGGFLGE